RSRRLHTRGSAAGGDYLFFFQAEDGIRDFHVTGVQTCALPISRRRHSAGWPPMPGLPSTRSIAEGGREGPGHGKPSRTRRAAWEIGRASCREREWVAGVAVSTKKKGRRRKATRIAEMIDRDQVR